MGGRNVLSTRRPGIVAPCSADRGFHAATPVPAARLYDTSPAGTGKYSGTSYAWRCGSLLGLQGRHLASATRWSNSSRRVVLLRAAALGRHVGGVGVAFLFPRCWSPGFLPTGIPPAAGRSDSSAVVGWPAGIRPAVGSRCHRSALSWRRGRLSFAGWSTGVSAGDWQGKAWATATSSYSLR